MSEHVPVVIVGAGPTGATAAIMLARRGIRCLVLERHAEPYPLPRAVHFDDEVFRILAGIGLADELRAISRPASGMRLVDARMRRLAEFTRAPDGGSNGHPQANMFDQPTLERLLRRRMAEHDEIEVRGRAEVVAVTPAVRYRDGATGAEHEVHADAVLGCDGATGPSRAGIGAGWEDLGFTQDWLVMDVISQQPLGTYDGVQQVCDHERAATFMMVTPGRYRWEFRLGPGESEDQDITSRVRPWLGTVDPASLTVLRRARYTFRGALAGHWRSGRVFLLGDAAHLTPPFIGQGLGAGIRDAANLTWKLALVLSGQADDRLLDTYESERRPHTRQMVRMAVLIGWMMTGGSRRTAPLRRAVLASVTRLPGVEQRALDVSWPAYRRGPLVGRGGGQLCPQPRVGTEPLDRLLGNGFAVITRTPVEMPGMTVLAASADRSGALTRLLDAQRTGAILLRPDRYIAAKAAHPDPPAWRTLLASAGIPAGGQDSADNP